MFLNTENKNKTEDTFCRNFIPQEYDILKDTQKALEYASRWGVASKLVVLPMESPMDANVFFNNGNNLTKIPLEILLDTAENAGIMLDADGIVSCLRTCALPSLLATAGISGGGVSRVSKTALADSLRNFLYLIKNLQKMFCSGDIKNPATVRESPSQQKTPSRIGEPPEGCAENRCVVIRDGELVFYLLEQHTNSKKPRKTPCVPHHQMGQREERRPHPGKGGGIC